MQTRPFSDVGGPASAVSLALSLLAIAVLHAVTTTWDAGGAAAAVRRPDEVLAALLAWIGLALAGWLALGSALALLARLPGAVGRGCGLLAHHLTPLLLRRVLTAAVGTTTVSLALPPATVVGTVSAPSQAAQPQTSGGAVLVSQPARSDGKAATAGLSPSRPPARGDRGTGVPDTAGTADSPGTSTAPGPGYRATPRGGSGLRHAAAPTSSAQSSSAEDSVGPPVAVPGFRPTRPLRAHDQTSTRLLAPAPRPAAAALDTVTVRRGDSLWSIAQRHLGAGATDAEIAHAWPEWYAANRAVIGDDPDLIHPGMQLVPPREGDLR